MAYSCHPCGESLLQLLAHTELALQEDILCRRMGLTTEDHIIVATEPADLARASREQMAEIIFEQFGAPGLSLQRPGVCRTLT